ncbi:hypothetical protein [Sphingomonas faeni]|uniref:hypothetical protein n=1 Tax=Sphingomonas faeni TaxID=185950 RepID=UPI003359C15A
MTAPSKQLASDGIFMSGRKTLMLLLNDRAAMAHALTLDLDPTLLALLRRRIEDLEDLIDVTEILVIVAGDAESDIIRQVGFSPLVEPVDEVRFDAPGFGPFWDHLVDHGGWFELSISFGSAFAYVLFISDTDGVLPDLLTLCRHYTA